MLAELAGKVREADGLFCAWSTKGVAACSIGDTGEFRFEASLSGAAGRISRVCLT
jgi:hypothetical protein